MAKCVQVVGQGIPARLSDQEAFQVVVRDYDGQYCPKHVFRKYAADHPEHAVNKAHAAAQKRHGIKTKRVKDW